MSDGPENSRGRWWEIPGQGQPIDEGHRELMTDSRGRSRPERSLSAGADLAEESRHPARVFLWPIVSVVVAAGLLLSVVYVVKSKPTPLVSATSAEPATRSSAPQGDVAVKQEGPGVKPVVPSAQWGSPPAWGGGPPPVVGGAPPTIGGQAVTPRGPAFPGGPVGTLSGPVDAPSVGPSSAAGDAGNQPAVTTASSPAVPPREPPPMLDGYAPDEPGQQQDGKPEPSTGGCDPYNTRAYDCSVARYAFVYPAGTNNPYGPVPAGHYLSVCQSKGSKYSVENHSNDWWAWVRVQYWVWVPVVFLKGAPDNGPEPGLPVCDSGPTSTTPPSPPSVSSTPTSSSTAPPSTTGGPTTTATRSG